MLGVKKGVPGWPVLAPVLRWQNANIITQLVFKIYGPEKTKKRWDNYGQLESTYLINVDRIDFIKSMCLPENSVPRIQWFDYDLFIEILKKKNFSTFQFQTHMGKVW